MSDPANTLLLAALNADQRSPILWVVDENLPREELQQLPASAHLLVMTNRIDVADNLRSKGLTVQLSDFDFHSLGESPFAAVYYRVSKEKALVHHVINSSAKCLVFDGQLLLAGSKNEGIKTYSSKAAAYLGALTEKHKGTAGAQLSVITKTIETGPALQDKAYTQAVEITEQTVVFASKPGLYGWNKIDQGSQLLIAQLPNVLAEMTASPVKVLDLGCGYGYLSVMASRLMDAEFYATDNNVAAIEYCRENFSRHQVRGEVVLADCGKDVAISADLVLCNPPFHQGFAVEGDLTDRFLLAARQRLHSDGRAVFVVNSFIPLEKKAAAHFSQVQTLVNNKRFKVLQLKP